MNRFFTLICAVGTATVSAQTFVPDVNLILEPVAIPALVAAEIEGVIGFEPSTFRLYAEVSENWELQFIFGIDDSPLNISASNTFYQNPNGGPTSLQITPAVFGPDPAAEFDSWITIGAESEFANILLPLPDFDIFDAWETGNDLVLNNFFGEGIFVTTIGFTPQNSPDANGRILLGQFTVGAQLSGCMNLQFRKLNPDGSIFTDGSSLDTVVHIELYCFDSNPAPAVCLGDLTGSGVISAADVLAFLPNFGCSGPACIGDFNNDGFVNAADLLILLSVFGTTCN